MPSKHKATIAFSSKEEMKEFQIAAKKRGGGFSEFVRAAIRHFLNTNG